MAKVPALYLDPRGSGPPLKVGAELAAPGFDKVGRKHPLVRFLALEDVNIARGHRLELGPGDRAVGLSESAPILVAGVRSGVRFAALGFDVRESDLPLRVAWPLLLLNTLHWFTDEDSDYLSSFRTGEVWRVPVGSGVARATVKGPGGEELVPVLEGRASLRGRRAGFYELTTAAQGGEGPVTVGFAANLLDPEETAIAPLDRLEVGGQPAGEVGSFEVGVRREIWIYLLLAVALLTALEWATYHRRVTV